MDYQEFLNYVKDNILSYLELDCELSAEIETFTKNNGYKECGIVIRRSDSPMSPNIYLDRYYERYKKGYDITEIMESIASAYTAHCDDVNINIEDIFDYDKVKDHIIVRLVNTKSNKELAAHCPHLYFHDMTILFRWLVVKGDISIGSVQITNREFYTWGISVCELYETAIRNTKEMFPVSFIQLGNMLVGYLKKVMTGISPEEYENLAMKGVREELAEYIAGEVNQPPLYIMTNESDINGASTILYPEDLHRFAASIGKNIYVMPSSIHEFILLPEHDKVDIRELFLLVKEANEAVVKDPDVLSNSVYYYSLYTGQLMKLPRS